MSHLDLTSQNFKAEVLDFKGKVLVDFWAAWCGPCLMLAPIIEEISSELKDLKVAKLDVDQANDIASQYNVGSIPMVMLFVDGQIKETIVGFRQKQDYLDAINKY